MPQWFHIFRLKSAIWTGQYIYEKSNFHPKLSDMYKVLSPHEPYVYFMHKAIGNNVHVHVSDKIQSLFVLGLL